jgi:hypothetical protein
MILARSKIGFTILSASVVFEHELIDVLVPGENDTSGSVKHPILCENLSISCDGAEAHPLNIMFEQIVFLGAGGVDLNSEVVMSAHEPCSALVAS